MDLGKMAQLENLLLKVLPSVVISHPILSPRVNPTIVGNFSGVVKFTTPIIGRPMADTASRTKVLYGAPIGSRSR